MQYTAKNMTGLGKVAKEANKGLKFLDTRYVISALPSQLSYIFVLSVIPIPGKSFGDNTPRSMCRRLNKWKSLASVKLNLLNETLARLR